MRGPARAGRSIRGHHRPKNRLVGRDLTRRQYSCHRARRASRLEDRELFQTGTHDIASTSAAGCFAVRCQQVANLVGSNPERQGSETTHKGRRAVCTSQAWLRGMSVRGGKFRLLATERFGEARLGRNNALQIAQVYDRLPSDMRYSMCLTSPASIWRRTPPRSSAPRRPSGRSTARCPAASTRSARNWPSRA